MIEQGETVYIPIDAFEFICSGNSVEVFSPKLNKFTLATHGPSTPDRAYSATIITGGMATKRKQIT